MAHAGRIELTGNDRVRLEEMARSRTLAARKVLRAKIVLTTAYLIAGKLSFNTAPRLAELPT